MKTSGRHHLKTESPVIHAKGLLRHAGLRAKKGLGQHFLIDEDVLKVIVSAAELVANDVVVEIGPGLGVLTRELSQNAGYVIAVELDDKLTALLKQTMASRGNVLVVNQDILKIDPGALLQEAKTKFRLETGDALNYKVVANLPYYITSPVLRHFLEAKNKPTVMVVMVQKEVAEEITAQPGQMSVLSISVQLYGRPEIIGDVPARCFYPVPKVDSAILRIALYHEPAVKIDDIAGFFALVRAGFTAPRQQIVNSLSRGLDLVKSDALSLLEKAGILPQRRAETLSLEDWAHLWRVFSQSGKQAC